MKLKHFSFLSTCVVSLVLLATSASTFGYSLEDKMNNVQTTDAEKARENVQFKYAKFVDSDLATQSNQSHVVREKQDKTKFFTFLFAIISFMFILICVVAVFSTFERYQNKDKPISKSFFEQVPCRKCKYFHENRYVLCAVHPTITLTKEAFNCPDFCLKA